MGVSGGIWGLEVGFCAMLGGKREVYGFQQKIMGNL
jgi:6-phosphogluconate dehydrogenase (decarboxylating)